MHTDLREVESLGDEIAELSTHLDVATARLLDLIREVDARGGWGNGFTVVRQGSGADPRRDRGDRGAPARGESAQRHRSRALHVYQDEDGMVVVRGRLEPETGAVLMTALAAARETLYRQTKNVPAGTSPPGALPRTGLIGRLDVGWAIDVLHPLAR